MRQPVRAKKGRVVVAVDPRGGLVHAGSTSRAELVTATAPIDLPSCVERLAALHVAYAVAKADVRAGRAPDKSPRAYKEQILRLRKAMIMSGPAGCELATAVTLALSGQNGRFLQTAEKAGTSFRPYVQRAAGFLATFILGGIRTPLALVRAGSSALNEAMSDMLRDELVALDPTAVIGATRTRDIEGSKVRSTLPTFDAVMRMYVAISARAEKDAAMAAYLDKEGREEERQQARRWDEQRWASARTARTEAAATTPAEREDDEHEHQDSDVAGAGHSSPHVVVNAGDEGDAKERSVHETADRSSAVDLREAEHDDEPSSPAIEPGTFCRFRGRMVPASIANTRIPGAWQGAGWPEILKAENARIDAWTEESRRAQLAAAYGRTKR